MLGNQPPPPHPNGEVSPKAFDDTARSLMQGGCAGYQSGEPLIPPRTEWWRADKCQIYQWFTTILPWTCGE